MFNSKLESIENVLGNIWFRLESGDVSSQVIIEMNGCNQLVLSELTQNLNQEPGVEQVLENCVKLFQSVHSGKINLDDESQRIDFKNKIKEFSDKLHFLK